MPIVTYTEDFLTLLLTRDRLYSNSFYANHQASIWKRIPGNKLWTVKIWQLNTGNKPGSAQTVAHIGSCCEVHINVPICLRQLFWHHMEAAKKSNNGYTGIIFVKLANSVVNGSLEWNHAESNKLHQLLTKLNLRPPSQGRERLVEVLF